MSDPFESSLLRQDRLFIGRQILRDHLRSLCASDGARVLVVDGPPGSGKSHTAQVIRHLSETIGFRMALVNIEMEAFHALTPSDVAQTLARQMGVTGGHMPAPMYEMTSRHVLQLSDWLMVQINRSNAVWWFVFDGFDHADVPTDTRDFISRLVADADIKMTNLRIVLLGWSDDLVPLSLRSHVLRETIAPLSREDVRRFFEQLSEDGTLPLDPAGIEQVVEAVEQAAPETRGVPGLAMATARAVSLLR